MSEQSAHECLVLRVNWIKLRSVRAVVVDVGLEFPVDEARGFFFDCIVNDPAHFFTPDLFTLHVQEVLNVLNAAFETDEISFQSVEFSLINTELAHCSLLGVIDTCGNIILLFEDKLFVEHERHLFA
jgi:hypothetical protein